MFSFTFKSSSARIAAALLGYFTVMFVFLGMLAALGALERVRTDYAFLAGMNAVVGVLLTAVVMLAYRLLDRGNPWRLGFRVTGRDALFAAAALCTSGLLAAIFTDLAGRIAGLGAVYHLEKLQAPGTLALLAYGLIGWLFGVLQEEAMNRGYMLANLTKLRVPAMLLVSSLIFSLTHIPTKGLHALPLLIHFVGGCCYAYVYLKSGSLWISAAVHAMHNLMLDLLFNDNYGISLVSFAEPPGDPAKLLQQLLLAGSIIWITYGFYGRSGLFTPHERLALLWNSADRKGESKEMAM